GTRAPSMGPSSWSGQQPDESLPHLRYTSGSRSGSINNLTDNNDLTCRAIPLTALPGVSWLDRNTTNGLRVGCRFINLQTNVFRLGLRHSGKIHPEKAMFIPSSHSFTLYRRWD